MKADLNASLHSIIRKGRDLSRINDWRSLTYITREKIVISLEDQVDILIKMYKVKKKKANMVDEPFAARSITFI